MVDSLGQKLGILRLKFRGRQKELMDSKTILNLINSNFFIRYNSLKQKLSFINIKIHIWNEQKNWLYHSVLYQNQNTQIESQFFYKMVFKILCKCILPFINIHLPNVTIFLLCTSFVRKSKNETFNVCWKWIYQPRVYCDFFL